EGEALLAITVAHVRPSRLAAGYRMHEGRSPGDCTGSSPVESEHSARKLTTLLLSSHSAHRSRTQAANDRATAKNVLPSPLPHRPSAVATLESGQIGRSSLKG